MSLEYTICCLEELLAHDSGRHRAILHELLVEDEAEPRVQVIVERRVVFISWNSALLHQERALSTIATRASRPSASRIRRRVRMSVCSDAWGSHTSTQLYSHRAAFSAAPRIRPSFSRSTRHHGYRNAHRPGGAAFIAAMLDTCEGTSKYPLGYPKDGILSTKIDQLYPCSSCNSISPLL
jgi:hypothetical protein